MEISAGDQLAVTAGTGSLGGRKVLDPLLVMADTAPKAMNSTSPRIITTTGTIIFSVCCSAACSSSAAWLARSASDLAVRDCLMRAP